MNFACFAYASILILGRYSMCTVQYIPKFVENHSVSLKSGYLIYSGSGSTTNHVRIGCLEKVCFWYPKCHLIVISKDNTIFGKSSFKKGFSDSTINCPLIKNTK